jgi:hypothetical protein
MCAHNDESEQRERSARDERSRSPGIGRFEEGEVDDRRIAPERRLAARDRRRSPRRRLLKTGRTYWQNGDSGECWVRNLSDTGAQIEVRGPTPNAFYLVIGSGEFRRSCRVVWRSASRVGVRFVEQDGATKVSAGSAARTTETRTYAEVCRTLARSVDAFSREVLLNMAAAWEAHARRPRKKAMSW